MTTINEIPITMNYTCLCNIFNKPNVKPVSVFCVATGISRPNLFEN